MDKVSVTISTFNRCVLLKDILDALNEQTASSDRFEVIICDSYSSDGTQEMIENFRTISKYHIVHVHTKNNLAAKRNIGIKSASYPLVIFLDDDCVPELDFVTNHLDCFRNVKSGTRNVYCGEVRYPKHFVESSNYYRFRDSRHFGFSKPYSYPSMLDYKTIVVMNMCFEKELFLKEIVSVDESFVGYGAEDQDLGWRFQAHGYQILPCAAQIDHFETTGSISAYGSKIRRASRDGMNTLMRVNPDAAYGITALRKLDQAFPDRSMPDRAVSSLVFLFIRLRLHRALEFALEKTDGVRWLYVPQLYRVLMGVYYAQGSAERHMALTAEQAELGWEGSGA